MTYPNNPRAELEKPSRTIVVEDPAETPAPRELPAEPEPVRVPEKEREKIPA